MDESKNEEINDVLDNLNRGVKRHLDPSVYENFQKPKISKIVFNTKTVPKDTKVPPAKINSKTNLKHNFKLL